MSIWQSLGLQGNHHILPNKFSSDSIIESVVVISHPDNTDLAGISRLEFLGEYLPGGTHCVCGVNSCL